MNKKLRNLRSRLIKNETLFKWFLIGAGVITTLIIFYTVFINQVEGKIALFTIGSSGSSLLFFFLCFLNYRTKIGIHDILVDLYENSPPPPKIDVVKMISENSNFKVVKLKI